MGSYDGKTGVASGPVVDLFHEGTVLRESEHDIIDQYDGTVRKDKAISIVLQICFSLS